MKKQPLVQIQRIIKASAHLLLTALFFSLTLYAAQAASQGAIQATAGNDLTLGTVETRYNNRVAFDANNHIEEGSRTEVGSTLQAGGDITLAANNNLTARAAQVNATGALQATAGNNLTLEAGEQQQILDEAHQHDEEGFLSRTTVTTRDRIDRTQAQGATFSGGSVNLQAGNDLTLTGSQAVSDSGTQLQAGNNLTVQAAEERTLERHYRSEETSGLLTDGGASITLGSREQTSDTQGESIGAAGSTVGALQGDIGLRADRDYTQRGSDLIALEGDINVQAQQITIEEARERSSYTTETTQRQTGLTISLSNPLIDTLETGRRMRDAAEKTDDPRMQALAGGAAALSAYNNYDTLQQSRERYTAMQNENPEDANPLDQIGGIRLSASLGTSRSSSTSTQTGDYARGSSLQAGGSINLQALPESGEGTIKIQGSELQAGKRKRGRRE